jgi:Ca2+:H+ antiporter
MRRNEQVFHEVISETGSGLMLVAGFGLLIPSAFSAALSGTITTDGPFTKHVLEENTHKISRATAIALLVAFFL